VVGLVIVLLVAGSGHEQSTFRDDFRSSRSATLSGRSLIATPPQRTPAGASPTWSTPRGSFIVAEKALTGGPTSSHETPSLAVVEISGTARMIVAHFDRLNGDLGVIFRYADPHNYWILVPARGYATWNLYSIESGNTLFRGNTGLSGLGNGTVTLKLSGADIEVDLGRRLKAKLSSKVLIRSPKAGLIAFAGASFGSDAEPGRCLRFAITVER
jgi:hypothetical protein